MVLQIPEIKFLKLLLLTLISPALASSKRTQHYSFFSDQPEIYLSAIKSYKASNSKAAPKNLDGKIRAGILPHHFLANWMMVDFFEELSSRCKPKRIILMGPDHFRKGLNPVSISSLPWKTPFGMLSTDLYASIEARNLIGMKQDNEAFSGEHSVGLLVPFVRYYFPDAKVLAIILKWQMPLPIREKFGQWIKRQLEDPNTIILLSMDFSHYQTSDEADRRDKFSEKAILTLDSRFTDQLDIDCHSGLYLLLSALSEEKDMKVSILHHSNSAKITGHRDVKSVTSYHTVLFYR